jgi:hypothetical protein
MVQIEKPMKTNLLKFIACSGMIVAILLPTAGFAGDNHFRHMRSGIVGQAAIEYFNDPLVPVQTCGTIYAVHFKKSRRNADGLFEGTVPAIPEIGRVVAKFNTDTEGNFAVSLPEGDYMIVPDTLSIPGLYSGSLFVEVDRNSITPVTIIYSNFASLN